MSAHPGQRRTQRFGGCGGFAASLCATVLAACIPLPIPHSSGEIGPVPDRIVAHIKSVTTTRADVLLLLGEPIVRGPDDAYFVYSWAYRRGGVTVVGLTGGGPFPLGDVQEYSCRALAVRFAATGQVDRAETFEGSVRSAVSGLGLDKSISALCRHDSDLIDRIRAWVAEPTAPALDRPPGASSQP